MSEQPPTYPETLRAAILATGSSRRRLSYALAEKTDNKQTSEYRALGKYLRGDEMPDPERAAIMAVELREPRLALVTGVAERRSARRAELEARVADLEALATAVLPQLEELASRVVALEQQQSARQRRAGKASPS